MGSSGSGGGSSSQPSGRDGSGGDAWGNGGHGGYQSRSGAFSGRGPKGYSRSDDRVKEDVCERLMHNGDVDAGDVEVEVKDGTVTLTGSVDARWMKHRIEDIADGCSGVKDVRNQVNVSRGNMDGETDSTRGEGAQASGTRTSAQTGSKSGDESGTSKGSTTGSTGGKGR